ncbi:unnamed protein product [Adineta steineri]|uniref:F-box domain-containing protein n=3 Tax=Adineta steineri TaxID=433720 RepID=A0A819FZH4_9BILA|nr:unnamed protein product [Adineta steineri]
MYLIGWDHLPLETTNETNSSSKEPITTFEDLSNELFYEIFDCLIDYHAFEAFYHLNNRFQNLFLHSNLPTKINVSEISISKLEYYSTHIIEPCTHRIKSFRLSNPSIDPCLLLFPITKYLTQLTTLILNKIEANHIEPIINRLSSLPALSSLTIISINKLVDRNNIYYKLFRLSKLKYCQISIESLQCPKSLLDSTNEFSTIEYLVINNEISIDQLITILSHVPQLRRLSIGNLTKSKYNRKEEDEINLNHLTNVSLKLERVFFDEFENLMINYFRQVQVLSIETQLYDFTPDVNEYINADRWERLISTHLLNLRIFDLKYSSRGLDPYDEHKEFETLIDKFNSKFWIEHQWFFNWHFHKRSWYDATIFYSRNPYRRKDNISYDQLGENIWSDGWDINDDPIDHIFIHGTDMIEQSKDKFPNATKLTFCEYFEVPRDFVVVDLNHIFPLKKITKLSIQCSRFSFEKLIELLQFTSNVHTLEFDSIICHRNHFNLIQQNPLTQLVSKTNMITKVTIKKNITLEKIQLLTGVFPRMENLTINLLRQDLEPIAQFLLSKPNNNTRYLSSLCISKQLNDLMIIMKNLIESKKLLHDYILKVINRKLYLWW